MQCKSESTHDGKVQALPLPQRRVAPGLAPLEVLGGLCDIQRRWSGGTVNRDWYGHEMDWITITTSRAERGEEKGGESGAQRTRQTKESASRFNPCAAEHLGDAGRATGVGDLPAVPCDVAVLEAVVPRWVLQATPTYGVTIGSASSWLACSSRTRGASGTRGRRPWHTAAPPP